MRCYTTFLPAGSTALYENVAPGTMSIGSEGENIILSTQTPRAFVEQFPLAYCSMAPPEDWQAAPGEMSLSSLDEWAEYFRQALSERAEALRAAFYREFEQNPEVILMCVRHNPAVYIADTEAAVDHPEKQGYQAEFVCGLAVWLTEPKELAEETPTTEFGFQRPWQRDDIEFLDGRRMFQEWASEQLRDAVVGTPVS